jgi:hypothetical protein
MWGTAIALAAFGGGIRGFKGWKEIIRPSDVNIRDITKLIGCVGICSGSYSILALTAPLHQV